MHRLTHERDENAREFIYYIFFAAATDPTIVLLRSRCGTAIRSNLQLSPAVQLPALNTLRRAIRHRSAAQRIGIARDNSSQLDTHCTERVVRT